MNFKYNYGILGGTFDHLHLGHKTFLKEAFSQAKTLTIGIADAHLISDKKLSSAIEDMDTRTKNLKAFLKENDLLNRTVIIEIHDIYGTSLTDKNIEAIFVTEHNLNNANLINQKRKEKKLPLLDIVEIPLLADSNNNTLSSTSIRLGKMDRNGENVGNYFEGIKDLVVTERLRADLSKPFGITMDEGLINTTLKSSNPLFTVGDITTYHFVKRGKTPDVIFFDLITERSVITDAEVLNFLPTKYITLSNPKGTIHVDTAIKINTLVHQALEKNEKIAIKISGEEDLLTLVAILIAPLKSSIVYGLQGKGMMQVKVTEEIKNIIRTQFINKFEKIKE